MQLKNNHNREGIEVSNITWMCVEILIIITLFVLVCTCTRTYYSDKSEIPESDIVTQIVDDNVTPIPLETVPESIETEIVEEDIFPLLVYDIPLHIDLQSYIVEISETAGIDPCIIYSIIWKESKYISDAVGDNGVSIGLMQIQRKWHEKRMKRLGVYDLTDPYQNVMVGVDYLRELMQMYDGNIEMALVAYNAGPAGAHKKYFSQGIYSNTYSQSVLSQAYSIEIIS